MSRILGILGVLGVLGEKKRRPDGETPSLQGFFVAWEADALPTELFPLNDLGLVGILQVSTWVSIQSTVKRFNDSTQRVCLEVDVATGLFVFSSSTMSISSSSKVDDRSTGPRSDDAMLTEPGDELCIEWRGVPVYPSGVGRILVNCA